jgi:DNA mismatch repair protein MutS2
VAIIERKSLELLQFDKIKSLIEQECCSKQAKLLCANIHPESDAAAVLNELYQTVEIKSVIGAPGYFPSVQHEDISGELNLLGLPGILLSAIQFVKVLKTTEVANTVIRFVKGKKSGMPALFQIAAAVEPADFVIREIARIIDPEAQVKDSASPELMRIRKLITEKKRESDKRFYNYIGAIRKHGYLRENEESFFNGRRTLALMVEFKSEIPGFVHSKSESGKTIFIEPAVTISINNDISELELDEHREINRILRELCSAIQPHAQDLKRVVAFLVHIDFMKARALLAVSLNATMPQLTQSFDLNVVCAVHPVLFLQNKRAGKKTVSLSMQINNKNRIIVISGPNAGGKTIALKTIGLLQVMLQSGLLIPVNEESSYCFFEKILLDMGDTQSIENELSTYSAKLKSMTSILNQVNEGTLALMDEFGIGTDPELGGAIAEAVLENLVKSQTRGIITSHFGNVKLLAGKLDGAMNASMLFDIETLDPKYILSIGQPGSSYTFEVAERIGFPRHLIERAKQKVDKEKLKLNELIAELQAQRTKLEEQLQNAEHQGFLKKIAKEKYHALYNTWEEKMNRERDRKIELSRLADFGQRYLRLMQEWNGRNDRKAVIKKFIDSITAESKKQELLRKQKKLDSYAEKKIARIKPALKVGSKVKVLNSREIGVIEAIKDEKVYIKFGLMKMSVGMENLVLADE